MLNTNLHLQFARFVPLVLEQQPGKLILKEQGYGENSAKSLAKIFKFNNSLAYVDLSMNNLYQNLDGFIQGLKQNDRIVSLKLKNNSIDGRKCAVQLFNLVHNHKSLTAIDLGNSDNIKNRNRIYDEGLEALVEGMAQTPNYCIISEIHLQSACITGEGLKIFSRLHNQKIDLQILNLANNDLGNSPAFCLKDFIGKLVSLNLSNTKLGIKGCLELTKHFKIALKSGKSQL